MHARNAPTTRHMQHIALTEQLFRALFAKDGAAINLGCDLEGNARREIRLDGAGDDIHRRPLCGHDHMDTRGARHLRQPLHGCFNVLAGHDHQIGHFINHHHNHGQCFQREWLIFKNGLVGFRIKAGLHAPGQSLTALACCRYFFIVARDIAHAQLAH